MMAITSRPATTYATKVAGPAAATPLPEPTKSPVPIADPKLIITRWRPFIRGLHPAGSVDV